MAGWITKMKNALPWGKRSGQTAQPQAFGYEAESLGNDGAARPWEQPEFSPQPAHAKSTYGQGWSRQDRAQQNAPVGRGAPDMPPDVPLSPNSGLLRTPYATLGGYKPNNPNNPNKANKANKANNPYSGQDGHNDEDIHGV